MRLSKNWIFLLLILTGFFVPSHSISQNGFAIRLADSAFLLTKDKVIYDPSYFSIEYPMGDVPAGRGVCTDVVIRAYRKMGMDLQQLVHEDMKAYFHLYPKIWGLTKPDKNIDHRRVPNLMRFFERHGTTLELTNNSDDYSSGDIICWDLGGGITHIGIVSNRKVPGSDRLYIIHNIGRGQVLEDVMFDWKVIGHYRYRIKYFKRSFNNLLYLQR